MDWSKYPNFSEHEFKCSHTGKVKMHPDFMERLQQIRTVYRKPMVINSGYRDRTHPIEARKTQPGEHSHGMAVDIAVRGEDAMELFVIAYGHGIRRIGVNQKGGGRFMHLGMGDQLANFPPALWSY